MKYSQVAVWLLVWCSWNLLDAFNVQHYSQSRSTTAWKHILRVLQHRMTTVMTEHSGSVQHDRVLNTRVHKHHQYSPYKRSQRPDNSLDIDSFQRKQQQHHYDDTVQFMIPDLQRCQQLANEGDIDAALKLFHSLPLNASCNLIKAEFNFLLRELGNQGAIDACVDVFNTLVAARFRPTLITYSTIISRAGHWKRIDVAEKFFQDMLSAQIAGDVNLYTSMMTAYGKVGQLSKALDYFQRMLARNIAPSTITCNSLLDACINTEQFDQIPQILSRCTNLGVSFGEDTYATLIKAYCLQGKLEDAELTLQTMLDKKLMNSTFAYSTLINAYGQRGDLTKAFHLLSSMRKQGLEPNIVVISSLIHACGKVGEIEKAMLLFHQLVADNNATKTSKAKKNFPNSVTCSSLIDCCLKRGEIDHAFDVIRKMRQHRIPMNEVTYTSLISELVKRNELDRMNEALLPATYSNWNQKERQSPNDNEIESMQSEPVLASLLTVLQGKDVMVGLLETLQSHRWLPSIKAIEVTIKGASSADELHRLEQLVSSIFRNENDADQLLILQSLLKDQKKAIRTPTQWASMSKQIPRNITELFVRHFEAKEFDHIFDLYLYSKQQLIPLSRAVFEILMKSVFLTAQHSVVKIASSFSNSVNDTRDDLSLSRQQLSRLFRLFGNMKDEGIQPDVGVYNSLINRCAAVGNLDKAMEILESMRADGIEPTVITFTSLIKACSKVGGRAAISKGEDIFEAMQQRTNHFSSYVQPNPLTYEQIIYLHVNSGTEGVNTTRIDELFRDMRRQHFVVDTAILRYCLKTAVSLNNKELAKVTLSTFIHEPADSEVYQACIHTANEVCKTFGWGNIANFQTAHK